MRSLLGERLEKKMRFSHDLLRLETSHFAERVVVRPHNNPCIHCCHCHRYLFHALSICSPVHSAVQYMMPFPQLTRTLHASHTHTLVRLLAHSFAFGLVDAASCGQWATRALIGRTHKTIFARTKPNRFKKLNRFNLFRMSCWNNNNEVKKEEEEEAAVECK